MFTCAYLTLTAFISWYLSLKSPTPMKFVNCCKWGLPEDPVTTLWAGWLRSYLGGFHCLLPLLWMCNLYKPISSFLTQPPSFLNSKQTSSVPPLSNLHINIALVSILKENNFQRICLLLNQI